MISNFTYGVSEDFSKDFRKKNKKIFAFKSNRINYTLFIKKNNKNKSSYTSEHIAYLIQDSIEQNSDSTFYYSKQKKEIALFKIVKDEDNYIYHVLLTVMNDIDEDKVSTLREDFFDGFESTEILETEKELKKKYAPSQIGTILALVFTLSLLGSLFYVVLFEDSSVAVTEKVKPPMPIEKPLTSFEKHRLENIVSEHTLLELIKIIDIYKDRKEFNIKRISSVSLSYSEYILFSKPQYNEPLNVWEHTKESEKRKRGGIKRILSVRYQQKYPSVGYKLSFTGDENDVPLYTKEDRIVIEKFTEVEKEQFTTEKSLDKSCLEGILVLVEEAMPEAHDVERVFFKIRQSPPHELYSDIKTIMNKCPSEINSLSVKNGMLVSKISLYKGKNNE